MTMSQEAASTVAEKVVTAAPPAVVASLSFAGFTLPDLVQLVTLLWLLLLIVDKLWTLYLRWNKGRVDDEPV